MPNISLSSIILATKNTLSTLRKEGGLDDLSGQLKSLKKSRFVRDVTIVAGGTAVAQAITVAFSPIITRLYGPEAFGVLGVFVAILAMLTPVATLTYALAIVLPTSDGEARVLVKLSLIIGSSIAILLTGVLGLFHNQIAHLFGFEASALYLLLVPIVVFFAAAEESLSQWLIRKKQFRAISGVAVVQTATVNISKAGFGFILATAPVLLVLNAIGHLLRTVLLWLGARYSLFAHQLQKNSLVQSDDSSLRTVANKYRDFPFYRSPQKFLNTVYMNLPILILAAFWGPVPAGFYALSRRVLGLPSSLIAQSVGKVFLPKIAEVSQQGNSLQPYIIRTTAGLALIGLLPFGVVAIWGPHLFGFIFGDEWVVAGEYARWLSFLLYFAFLNYPSVHAIPFLNLQRWFLFYEVLLISLLVFALIIGVLLLSNDVLAVALFSIVGALLQIVLISWVIVRSSRGIQRTF